MIKKIPKIQKLLSLLISKEYLDFSLGKRFKKFLVPFFKFPKVLSDFSLYGNIIVVIIGNGLNKPSSNPGWGYFTLN